MTAARVSSIQRFKRLSEELQKEIRADSVAELNAGADDLVAVMKASAPLGPTGRLRQSIRKEPGKKDTQVKVKAGGPLTTVRNSRGHPYDYSRAVEFGASGTQAKPFFWTTWRMRRKRIRSRLKRKITANIKKKSAA